jgi:hypothetical protein
MSQRLNKSRLTKLVKDAKIGKYHASISDVIFWYGALNDNIFEGKLPPLTGIQFRQTKTYWAEALCYRYKNGKLRAEFTLSTHFPSFKDFVEVMAHEMVHVWEYDNYSIMGHGERFFLWEGKLKRMGLKLAVCQ